jgi:hypothetical protein
MLPKIGLGTLGRDAAILSNYFDVHSTKKILLALHTAVLTAVFNGVLI